MIIKIGNIFDSNAKTLVNTVNCVGVMGKGIALDFKKRYPAMFDEYISLCKRGIVKPGRPYYYEDLCGVSILNFPTKDHWRSPSKLSYIESGLQWFREHYKEYKITSIAFPPLGCGNGGLTWDLVGPLMYSMLKDLPIAVEIYAPYGTSKDQLETKFLEKSINISSQNILGSPIPYNKYWLLILYVVQKLNQDKYSLSVGRTIFQKICYLLTRVGIPTGFNFVRGSYGPYAQEVKNAITVLSNTNYMTECQSGKMIETVVSPLFKLPKDLFTQEELERADSTFDLLSRVKSTEQAEIITTVLFSYDSISKEQSNPQITDQQVFDEVMSWKPHWAGKKDQEVYAAIYDLASLGWMNLSLDNEMILEDDNLF